MSGDAEPVPVELPSEWNPAIQSLVRSLDEARYFQGSLVVVHGPPGVGKTRLIHGALREAHVSTRRVRQTFLEPRDTESPYKAVLSLARWAAKLEEIGPALDTGSLVLMPLIRSLVSGPESSLGRRPESDTPGTRSPASSGYQHLVSDLEFYKRGVEAWGERSRFLHEIGWLILDAAARRHIVWIVESAQNLDASSLTVVRYLAACLDESPLVMWLNVDTSEDGRLPEAIAGIVDRPRTRAVEVPRLSRAGVVEVLSRKYPGQAVPDRVVDSILKESSGLLVTVEQLAADPSIVRGLSSRGSGESTDVLAVLLRHIDHLSPSARGLLEPLAVAGEQVTLDHAIRLAGRSEAEVQNDLNSLVSTGLLLELGPGEYLFRITALPGEIESRLPDERLRELHRAAAEALAESSSEIGEKLFDLADHWRKAEDWDPAARASLEAARFSSDNFAPEGGLLHAQRALDATRRLSSPHADQEAEALIEKGRALYDLGRLHESLEALREAVRMIPATAEGWPSRARALFYLARALSSIGRPQEAFEVVEEASSALAEVNDSRARLMLHQVIGVALMMTDQNREAVDHFRSMLSIAEKLGDAREVSYAQKNLSAVLLALDPHDEEGWTLVDAAIDHHTRTNNFAGLAAGFLNRSITKLQLEDTDGALKDLAHSREAAELAHAPLLIATATLQEATVRMGRSEIERADGLLKALGPWMPAMEEPSVRVSFYLLNGRVAEAQHRTDEAEKLYEEATLIAEPGGESPLLWECRLRQAALAKRMGATERYRHLRETLPSREQIGKVAPALAPLRAALEAPSA